MFLFFPLLFAGFFGFLENVLADENDLIITEIMYDPAGNNSEHSKWIEIYNLGEDFVFQTKKLGDLYKLLDFYTCDSYRKKKNDSDTDKCVEHSITTNSEAEIVFDSKGYLIITDNTEKFKADYLINQKVLKSSINLTSEAAFIKLCFQDDDHCSVVKYGEFFKEKNEGYSLEKIDFNSNNSADNWQKSYVSGGTPGKESSIKPEPKIYSKGIYINEILPNAEEEFIELFNPGENDEDLSGWILRDGSKTGKYVFPENSVIKGNDYLVVYKKDFKFALNNSGDESVNFYDPNETLVSSVSYDGAKEDISYNFDGTGWRWSKYLTPGAENEFNESTGIKIKAERKIYKNTYADFKAQVKNPDNDKLKFTWDFGDGHKSYKKNTRHKYDKTGKFKVMLKVFDGSEETTEEFKVEVKKFPKNKIKITKVSPNPEGKDSDNEYIIVKNGSKKKINLKNWAIASGSKKLYNHPINKNLVIKPGEEVKIGRDISKFALNNKKSKIELRYPDGRVAYEMKYNKKEESVKEGEIYEKTELGWAWKMNNPETLLAIAGKNIDAEVTAVDNVGEIVEKNSENQALSSEEKLALSSETNNISPENEKVLGTFVEVKENNSDDVVNKTENQPKKPNVIMRFIENVSTGINSFINRIILKFF